MPNGSQPASSAEREPLAHPLVLSDPPGNVVARDRRTKGRVANCQTPDLGGRRHVAIQQGRRHGQHVGVVVESEPRIVCRQQGAPIDLEMQQVAYGVDILGPIQPMHGRPPRIRIRRRRHVKGAGQIGRELFDGLGIGTPTPLGRHPAATDLPQHVLPHLGVRRDIGGVDRSRFEDQADGLHTRVVARDAVRVEQPAPGVALRLERTAYRIAQGHKGGGMSFVSRPSTAHLLARLGADTSLGPHFNDTEREEGLKVR